MHWVSVFYFQSKRLGALNKFKSKDRSLLIATDVASRGLDIPHVDVVINFDIPTHSKVKKLIMLTWIVRSLCYLFSLNLWSLGLVFDSVYMILSSQAMNVVPSLTEDSVSLITGLYSSSWTNSKSWSLRTLHHFCHTVSSSSLSLEFDFFIVTRTSKAPVVARPINQLNQSKLEKF